MDTGTAFGERLRDERDAAGLTQQQLGELLDPPFTGAAIGKYESGQPPGPAVVFSLEHVLGLPPGTLSRPLGYLPVGGDHPDTVTAINRDERLDDRMREIVLDAYRTAVRLSQLKGE